MFIVVVDHFCKPDRVDEAIDRIDRNGDQMARLPGFLFRYRMTGTADPLRMSTVTAWTDAAAYDAWIAKKRTIDLAAGPSPKDSPYERAVNTTYDVAHVHGNALK
jgi:heme-degrading monooxygenase HmoA